MYKIAVCHSDLSYVRWFRTLMQNIQSYTGEFLFFEYTSGEEFISNTSIKYDLVFIGLDLDSQEGDKIAQKYRFTDMEAILILFGMVKNPEPDIFRLNPFRYLMKDYNEQRIIEEIDSILSFMYKKNKKVYLTAFGDGKVTKISTDNIMYISVLKRGSHIWATPEAENNEIYTNIRSDEHIDKIYRELKDENFEYAHNSYIVNFQHIIAANSRAIVLENGIELNISRGRSEIFHKRFSEYLGRTYKRTRNI